MKAPLTAVLASLLILGCATPSAPQQAGTGAESRVRYLCENGEEIELRHFPLQGVGVLVRGGEPLELQEEVAASGFRYGKGAISVHGKGDELLLLIGRMVPIRCQIR